MCPKFLFSSAVYFILIKPVIWYHLSYVNLLQYSNGKVSKTSPLCHSKSSVDTGNCEWYHELRVAPSETSKPLHVESMFCHKNIWNNKASSWCLLMAILTSTRALVSNKWRKRNSKRLILWAFHMVGWHNHLQVNWRQSKAHPLACKVWIVLLTGNSLSSGNWLA